MNRPNFGGGLQQLVFAGNSPELAATVQFMVQGNLQQHLSDLIEVNAVQVEAIDSALQVRVDYVRAAPAAPDRLGSSRCELVVSRYFCANPRRRDEVRKVNFLNGIDFIEVAPADQRTLLVHFLHPVAGLTKGNFRIIGGVRTDVCVDAVVATAGEVVTLKTDRSGDFSTYTLALVTSPSVSDVPPGFDPMLGAVSFSFKVNCPSDFDCAPATEARNQVCRRRTSTTSPRITRAFAS